MATDSSTGTNQVLHLSIRSNARRCLSHQSRLVWIVSAGISLLSTRYLLVESNIHFPLLLYLAQLSAVALAAILQYFLVPKTHNTNAEGMARNRLGRGSLMAIVAMCFAALSLICMLQAILHNKNLPTLVMLTAITLFTDDFVYVLGGFTHCSRAEALRIILLLMACVGILTVEYRLSIPSLITSISAMLFAGVASALRRAAIRHHTEDFPSRKEETCWFLGAGYIIATIWITWYWPDKYMGVSDFRHVPMFLLLINLAATTSALLVGRSTIFPMDEDLVQEKSESDLSSLCNQDAFLLAIMAGIAGCSCAFPIRRSYSNWIQYGCFAVAVACASLKPLLASGHIRLNQQHVEDTAYELVDNAYAMRAGDEEEASGVKDDRNMSHRDLPWTKTSCWNMRSITQGGVVVLLWVLSLCLNFSDIGYTQHDASIDNDYEPAMPLEIVLSMYKEPIVEVRDLITGLKSAPETGKAPVTIYIKDHEANTEEVKSSTGADKVIKLPNVGREGETYLQHIGTRWDSLAKHTIYLTADLHFSRAFYRRLRTYFDPSRTGFLNLGLADTCNCEDCGDKFFWYDNAGLFPEYHSKIFNSTECKDISISYKGEFLVSAARTRGIDKGIYNELREALVDQNSWAHRSKFLQGKPDLMSNPYFGYAVERMWSLIFQCSDMDVAWKCPSLMSGWRAGGDVADCQCFDSDTTVARAMATEADLWW